MELTAERVSEILGSHLLTQDSIKGQWVLTIDGKLYRSGVGKFIFDSRSQAATALYNSSWEVKRILYSGECGEMPDYRDRDAYSRWCTNYRSRQAELWKDFRKELIDHHNLQIVQI